MRLYHYAWFVGFGIAGLVYYLMTDKNKPLPVPAEVGPAFDAGNDKPDEPDIPENKGEPEPA